MGEWYLIRKHIEAEIDHMLPAKISQDTLSKVIPPNHMLWRQRLVFEG